MQAVILAFFTFISTSLGGIFAFRFRDKLHFIMSFTAGVIIGVCFFDILPEVFSITETHGLSITTAMLALVFGFLLIHTLEKLAVIHHGHEEEYAHHGHHPTIGLISAGGLVFHSFLDGIGIGLGFHISSHVGLLVAMAVIAHDFSDGLNTVTLMLSNRNTTTKAIGFLAADAVAPIFGALSTMLFVIPSNVLQLYLGFFVGFLLYIAAADLLPEAHSTHSSYRLVLLTITGVVLIFLVTRFV